jgi:hypothetical protein
MLVDTVVQKLPAQVNADYPLFIPDMALKFHCVPVFLSEPEAPFHHCIGCLTADTAFVK